MKEPTEFQYFKAWLFFFLVATVGGGILGIIIGSFVAAFLGAGGMPLPQMTRILQIVGFVIAVPISYVTFRAVVGKYLFPKLEDDSPPKT
jgi:putative flippase GtrA